MIDITTGDARRGYLDVVAELQSRFPNPDKIVLEKDKKDFAKLFGEYNPPQKPHRPNRYWSFLYHCRIFHGVANRAYRYTLNDNPE
jgi:hypothetical protein